MSDMRVEVVVIAVTDVDRAKRFYGNLGWRLDADFAAGQVSEVSHRVALGKPNVPGPHPQRQSYNSFASFTDPDGNTWVLQEVTARLPGRGDT